MAKTEFGRRDFLKLAGVTSAVGGAAVAASAALPKNAKAEIDKPANVAVRMAVKYLDQPNYDLPPYADGSKLERYNGFLCGFSNPEVQQKYAPGYMVAFDKLYENVNKRAINGDYGWSLRDVALSEAGWQSALELPLDWGENYENPFQATVDALGKWDKGEEENALIVKKAANYYGAGAVGICEVHERWIYTHAGGDVMPFQPGAINYIEADQPHKAPYGSPEESVIPNRCKNAVVMLMPLDSAIAKYQPTGFNPANGKCYSRFTELVNKVAVFIRMLGWTAIPCGNDTGLSIPFALDAGLGELGRHGLLISPEYGSACKICKVLTDMPLKHDKPIQFGAAEFCKTCGKCANSCPSKSISKDPEPSYTTYALSNHAGMKKWYVNTDTCFGYWVENGLSGCNVCAHVCTYSKPQTWVHDIIKLTTSKTSLFNSVFAKMDDAFGYGATIEDQDDDAINTWWEDSSWTRTYDWERHTW